VCMKAHLLREVGGRGGLEDLLNPCLAGCRGRACGGGRFKCGGTGSVKECGEHERGGQTGHADAEDETRVLLLTPLYFICLYITCSVRWA
jgi:hypothetical protein